MKTMKFLTYTIFVLFLGVTMSSCSGDDGTDGTNGADGAVGMTGADGADGNDGTNGQDGNANVIYSNWITPTWTPGTLYQYTIQEYDINAPQLTQEVMDSGVVIMYWKTAAGYIWPLPQATTTLTLNFVYTLSTIKLYCYYAHNITATPTAPTSYNVFRYVLIPGNIPSKSATNPQEEIYTELKNAEVDINDYHDVCDYYGINP